jgi:hypothetical protein
VEYGAQRLITVGGAWAGTKKTELIVKTSTGPSVTQPGRNGVVFTIDPNQVDAAPTRLFIVTTKRVGASMSVGHAQMFCPLLPGPAYNWR